MQLFEKRVSVPAAPGNKDLIKHIENALSFRLVDGEVPIRLAVTAIDNGQYNCEVGCIVSGHDAGPSIFDFRRRETENADRFNVVYLVPTGVGAEVGGHAGDATPAAQLLASICDHLVTHPNVVNASDINELPTNASYVEGSVICRLLMGTAALKTVRANRVLVVIVDVLGG